MIVQLDIDARGLLFPVYIGPSGPGTPTLPTNEVGGQTPDSTKVVLSYSFDSSKQADLYQVWVMDAVRGELLFNLTPAGAITMASTPSPYFQLSQEGPAHWKLTISGFPVTLDGRYLTGKGLIVVNQGVPSFNPGPFRILSGGLIPASPGGSYYFEQGSSLPTSATFNVDLSGNITYAEAEDVANGGPFQLQGPKTLQLLGIPVLIDARAVTSQGSLGIVDLSGPPTSNCDPAVAFLNMLPLAGANLYSITVSGLSEPVATFQVDSTGKAVAQGTAGYDATVDTFHGVSRITIRRHLTLKPVLETESASHTP